MSGRDFFTRLESIIRERQASAPAGSYTAELFAAGPRRIAQKLGEEALELALASVGEPRERVLSEAADLFYHYTVLLAQQGITLDEVGAELESRHR